MNTENNEVLFKFRVTGTDGKPYVIFNGVNANSWLSPVGVRLSQEDKEQIPQRPKSSGSVMIIRHHPAPKGLKRDEVIHGISLKKKPGNGTEEEEDDDVRNVVSDVSKHRTGSRLTSAGRPHTSYSDRCFRRPVLQRQSENHGQPNLELTIRSFDLKKSSHQTTCEDGAKRDVTAGNPPHSNLVSKDVLPGRNVFAKRAKSAPPNVARGTSVTRRGPALYWRAKSAYHRKMLASCCDADWENADSNQSYKGSMLRPLLYSEDSELKHSAGCPYKCKGCFRACLVSRDYLERMNVRKDSSARKSLKQRPMVKKDTRFVMHMALARNQPIYKIVHGDDVAARTEAWTEKKGRDSETTACVVPGGEQRFKSDSLVAVYDDTEGVCDVSLVSSVNFSPHDRGGGGGAAPAVVADSRTSASNVYSENNNSVENGYTVNVNNNSMPDVNRRNVSSHSAVHFDKKESFDHSDSSERNCKRNRAKFKYTYADFSRMSSTTSSDLSSGRKFRHKEAPRQQSSVSPAAEEGIRHLFERRSSSREGDASTSERSFQREAVSSEKNEQSDDSLTEESTVSLGLLSDEEGETDLSSNGTEESPRTERSPSSDTMATGSEDSLSQSGKSQRRKDSKQRSTGSRVSSTNKYRNDSNERTDNKRNVRRHTEVNLGENVKDKTKRNSKKTGKKNAKRNKTSKKTSRMKGEVSDEEEEEEEADENGEPATATGSEVSDVSDSDASKENFCDSCTNDDDDSDNDEVRGEDQQYSDSENKDNSDEEADEDRGDDSNTDESEREVENCDGVSEDSRNSDTENNDEDLDSDIDKEEAESENNEEDDDDGDKEISDDSDTVVDKENSAESDIENSAESDIENSADEKEANISESDNSDVKNDHSNSDDDDDDDDDDKEEDNIESDAEENLDDVADDDNESHSDNEVSDGDNLDSNKDDELSKTASVDEEDNDDDSDDDVVDTRSISDKARSAGRSSTEHDSDNSSSKNSSHSDDGDDVIDSDSSHGDSDVSSDDNNDSDVDSDDT